MRLSLSSLKCSGDWRLSCRSNPLVIPVNHDLSVAFYHTKAILLMFRSDLVAISGVGLRTFQFFDPITISGCQSNEIYNPMGQRWAIGLCLWHVSVWNCCSLWLLEDRGSSAKEHKCSAFRIKASAKYTHTQKYVVRRLIFWPGDFVSCMEWSVEAFDRRQNVSRNTAPSTKHHVPYSQCC